MFHPKSPAETDAAPRLGKAERQRAPAPETARASRRPEPLRVGPLSSPVGNTSILSKAVPQNAMANMRQAVLQLQRTIGNRATTQLLRRLTETPPAPSSIPVQPKLTVGQPDDAYEREADAAASRIESGQTVDRISRLPADGLERSIRRQPAANEDEARTAAIQRKCAECEEEKSAQRKVGDEEEEVQTAALQLQKEEEEAQASSIQRQEEDEKAQASSLQRQEDEEEAQASSLQRQEEEEEVQASSIQRQEEEEEAQTLPLRRQAVPEEDEEPVQMRSGGSEQALDTDRAATAMAQAGGGSPLEPAMQAKMEHGLDADLSGVRVHTGSAAMEASDAINARAFTRGSDIYMGRGASPTDHRLMAHELTHVVQQGRAGARAQRYEAGEHAELGETQSQLKAHFAPTSYVVKKGEDLDFIAKKFGITVSELKAANKDKVKKWPAKSGRKRMIEGFNAGETVSIPQKLNDLAKAATKDKAAKITVNGVVLDYGVAIALGDLYENPGQMAKAPPKELKALATLIKREQSGGKEVSTAEWEKASGGRYLKLAAKNEAHFAPPSAAMVTPTKAGGKSANHKKEWETHHRAALDASKSGKKDEALMTNAFGDHFLTDAFAAGHLVNKRDVMEKFKSQLKLDAKGKEFTKDSKKFFDAVAADAFTGSVKTEFSKYESVETHWGIHPDIDRVSRFSILLQGIHKEEPDLLANAVAKGAHDKLNTLPGGLPVENAMGDTWNLSGDNTLNADTKKVALKAVAQSQLNVISVYNTTTAIKYPNLFTRVWKYTPKPSPSGMKRLVAAVDKGTNVKSADLKKAVVTLIKKNYKLIIRELVKRKKLQKA